MTPFMTFLVVRSLQLISEVINYVWSLSDLPPEEPFWFLLRNKVTDGMNDPSQALTKKKEFVIFVYRSFCNAVHNNFLDVIVSQARPGLKF